MYKIYIEGNRGYEGPEYVDTLSNLFKVLDEIVVPDIIRKILVIEHSNECDSVFYLYTGNYDDYVIFKSMKMLEQDSILQQYYEFVDVKKLTKK